jgi:5-methylcytosine-specific restriction endonuclease McrA
MADCQLCKRDFRQLKFETDHIKVCTRCVKTLNDFSEPAIHAQNRLGEMLAMGMKRNALRDLESADDWTRQRARRTLYNFDAAYAKALPGWLNRLLAEKGNTKRDFKTVRAHRRGLLRIEDVRPWRYPSNWKDVAADIRKRDRYRCVSCGVEGALLDVHHILYLSNFGTNQQSNLVTLCRPCHETEHNRVFDFGEPDDPEAPSPIQPKPSSRSSAEPATAAVRPPEFPTQPEKQPTSATGVLPSVSRAGHASAGMACPRCSGVCGEVFSISAGSVHRCRGCGFISRLQIYDDKFVNRAQTEALCEGAYVLEQVAQTTEAKAALVLPVVQLNVRREAQPVSRPASSYTPSATVPLSDEKSVLRPLLPFLPLIVVATIVVMVIVFIGLQ